ncbi:unnamed protein product, partial [Staurois parvus]
MLAGNGTRKTDAGIGRRTWLGTLQGGHRGSVRQGKCWRDPSCVFLSVARGIPLLVLK